MYFSIRSVFATNPDIYTDAAAQKMVLFKALISGTDEEFSNALADFNKSLNYANKNSSNSMSDKKFVVLYTWLQVVPIMMMHEISETDFNSHHIKYYYELETVEELGDITEINNAFFHSCRKYYTNKGNTMEYSSFTNECIDYISKNVYERFDLENLAKQLHYNSYYLSKKFKKETGMSISQYVLQAKITEARNLLESKHSIKTISDKLCFSSQSYFTECFKKNLGITPKQYQYLIKK